MAVEKAASSGAGLAQTREAGTGSSELAKAMVVRRAVSIALTLDAAAAARRRGKVGDFWNGVETEEDRGETERVRGRWPTGTGGRTGGGGGRIPGSRTVAHEGCGVDG